MKSILLFFLIVVFSYSLNAQTLVKQAASPVAIDGVPDESIWDLDLFVDGTYLAYFGLLWDDNYLYVAVEVEDDVLMNNHRQGHYDDGVEICVDGNHDQSYEYDENDIQFVKPVRSFWVQEREMKTEGLKNAFIENETGYTMEFAIPWELMDNTIPEAGKEVGFELVVNMDNDPNPYNNPWQMIWFGGSNYYQRPEYWGTITLSSEVAGFSDAHLAMMFPDNGEYLVAGEDINIEWYAHDIAMVNLEYSSDNGNTWSTVAGNLNAEAGIYSWSVPSDFSEEVLFKVTDASNAGNTDISYSPSIIAEPASVEPIIIAQWQNYRWPYNAYYPEDPNGINGHIGNACGPSSLSRIMHSWEYPRQGSGELSFTDYNGVFWSADFGNTIYNYDNMPLYLSQNATEPEYTDVATLMFHSIVGMHDIYGAGSDLPGMANSMHEYFNYTMADIAYMTDMSPAQWTKLMMNELDNGRSMLVNGMNLTYFNSWHTSNGIGGHWYHCDGYNSEGEFHVVVGFGDFQYDGYFDIEEFPLYAYNIGILTGLEPDFGDKELSLLFPNEGGTFTADEQLEIIWNSTNVGALQIEFTQDNGQTWSEIETAFDASAGSYTWVVPAGASNDCLIRLTDTENINVYDKSDETFSIQELTLALTSPSGGEAFVYNDYARIEWAGTAIPAIDVFVSVDNGNNWDLLVDGQNTADGHWDWYITQSLSSGVKIKIADSENPANFYISEEPFSIVERNVIGGPYKQDDHTVVLIHGEGNCINWSEVSGEAAVASGSLTYELHELPEFGKVMYLDNTSSFTYITIPDSDVLDLTGDWTMEMWFKPESFNEGLQYFLWKPGNNDEYFCNYAMQMNGYWGNELFCYYFSGDDRIGIQNGFQPTPGTWYHISFMRKTSENYIKLELRNTDREIIASNTIPVNNSTPTVSDKELRIGFNFSGYLDEIRISDKVRSYDPTGVELITEASLFNVFPNPSQGTVSLNLKEKTEVSVYDLRGNIVFQDIVAPGDIIDLNCLTPGVYLISVKVDALQEIKKLILQ